MRLIEWQNESSLFTLRVRGKQWYWVYKFELKNFTDILSAPKNVGGNKWLINVFGDSQTAEDFHHILQLRSQNKWVKAYWSETIQNGGIFSSNKNHVVLPQEQLKFDIDYANFVQRPADKGDLLSTDTTSKLPLHKLATDFYSAFLNTMTDDSVFWQAYDEEVETFEHLCYVDDLDDSDLFFDDYSAVECFVAEELDSNKKEADLDLFAFYSYLTSDNPSSDVVLLTDYTDVSATNARRGQGTVAPVRLIKNPLLLDNMLLDDVELFRLRFNEDSAVVQHKPVPHTTYLTLKQKRYKRKKSILPTKKFIHTEQDGKTKRTKMSYKPLLVSNAIFDDVTEAGVFYNPTRQYRMLKKNKARSEIFSVVTNRRMIRTKRTLVIPAHVNITIISNSYDVIHAWWIPGLGIKIDCVPGRSTHHTFFVDNVGFYYGQCAEICGRYHHHMPIRICALPFEHFLVWWYSFGLPKLLYTKQKKRIETTYGLNKYVW